VVEHFLHTEGVAGSNPAARTIFLKENGDIVLVDTLLTQDFTSCGSKQQERVAKFPKNISHRGLVRAVIYNRTAQRPYFRVSWRAGTRRLMKNFAATAARTAPCNSPKSLPKTSRKVRKLFRDKSAGSKRSEYRG
jgi:hypothetical protein